MSKILRTKRFTLILFSTFFLLQTVSSLLLELPELYIDNFAVWSINGDEYGPLTDGYNFTKPWSKQLPGSNKIGLGLYNFQTAPNSILSYQTSYITIDSVSTTINLTLVGSDARIFYMAFSLIVIPLDTPSIEFLELSASNLIFTSIRSYSIGAVSAKFNLTASEYYIHYFYEWITGDMLYYNEFYNYWSHIITKIVPQQNKIQISFWASYQVYMTGFKINLLLISKNMSQNIIYRHTHNTEYLEYRKMNFTHNLGIDRQLFSTEGENHCFHGLYYIDLYVFAQPSNASSHILFSYNNSEITEVTYSSLYGFRIDTFCYAMCPVEYMINGTCQNCRISDLLCIECLNDEQCRRCITGAQIMGEVNESCSCLGRTIANLTSQRCESCPFDCLTCDSSGKCLSCSAELDFRVLNSSTKRCDPLPGYYQSNQTKASQCHSSCMTCVSSGECQPCPQRTFENRIAFQCDPCPFDCLTCDSSGKCLSCSAELDFRVLNSSTKRCDPLPGYYQSNQTKASQCHSSCMTCVSSGECQPCPQRTFENRIAFQCDPCPFDCLTCDSSGKCLSCSAELDFRVLNSSTKRCDPLPGYYQSNQTKASQCSSNCLVCKSSKFCILCTSRFLFTPDSSQPCSPCPYDCYTCTTQGYCLSCNQATDFRQLNNTRCSPLIGYYQTNQTICKKCSQNCKYCHSSYECFQCKPVYYLQQGSCLTSCSARFYSVIINKTCNSCPYDCFTCNSSGDCLSCASSDNRQMNESSGRCVPKRGHFQTYQSVSSSCPSGCSQCVSEANCLSCSQGYIMQGSACQEQSGGGMMMIIGIVAGVAGGIILIIVIKCICHCRNRRNQYIAESQPAIPAPPVIPPIPINQWFARPYLQPNLHCSISLEADPTFKTACNHYFMPRCISQWYQRRREHGQRHDKCPYCRQQLQNKTHQIYCRQCKNSAKDVTLDQLKQIVRRGERDQDVVCKSCRDSIEILRNRCFGVGDGSDGNIRGDMV